MDVPPTEPGRAGGAAAPAPAAAPARRQEFEEDCRCWFRRPSRRSCRYCRCRCTCSRFELFELLVPPTEPEFRQQGVAAGIGDEAGEHDTAMERRYYTKVRPRNKSWRLPRHLMTEGLRCVREFGAIGLRRAARVHNVGCSAACAAHLGDDRVAQRSNSASVFYVSYAHLNISVWGGQFLFFSGPGSQIRARGPQKPPVTRPKFFSFSCGIMQPEQSLMPVCV